MNIPAIDFAGQSDHSGHSWQARYSNKPVPYEPTSYSNFTSHPTHAGLLEWAGHPYHAGISDNSGHFHHASHTELVGHSDHSGHYDFKFVQI